MGQLGVAPASGSVTHRSTSLGGLSFWLEGDDGTTYFGTHLSAYGPGRAGERRHGDRLRGRHGQRPGHPPHLHFEIHPGGGGAANPYPTLRANC